MTKSKEVKETPNKKAPLKVETLFPREEIMRSASAFGVAGLHINRCYGRNE